MDYRTNVARDIESVIAKLDGARTEDPVSVLMAAKYLSKDWAYTTILVGNKTYRLILEEVK